MSFWVFLAVFMGVLAVVLGVVCMLGLGKIDDKTFIDNIYRIYKQ